MNEKGNTIAALVWNALKETNPSIELIDLGVLDEGVAFVDIDNISYSEKQFKDTEDKIQEKISSGFSKNDLSESLGKENFNILDKNFIEGMAFSIFSVSGVYVDGDENNKQITRIRIWFADSQEKLDLFLSERTEEQENDHRKLNEKLKIFTISEVVGKGLPLYTNKGAALKRVLERFIVDEELRRGYMHVSTPEITSTKLYEKSGHLHFYKDSMFAPMDIDGEEFILRPMTCPHHFELFLSEPKSYRDLPLRIAEVARMYRYEKSGELTGLTRVRGFALSDAHIFCADKEQACLEVSKVLDLIEYININIFGLVINEDYWYRLSLGDSNDSKKYTQDGEISINDWKEAEEMLRGELNKRNVKFVEIEGEAAFYGPKIDIQMKSVTGKEDTAFTVQWDFLMPKRFDLKYVGKDGKMHETVVIHRSSIGSTERLISFLIEKYKGKFPFWLSPEQSIIISVQEEVIEFAKEVFDALLKAGIRVKKDFSDERLGGKIHLAKKSLIPYMIIVGKKDREEGVVTVESRDGSKEKLTIEKLIEKLEKENVPGS